MKNLYPKTKGKVHPSPSFPHSSSAAFSSASSASASASSGSGSDASSILKVLPAAILAMTTAMVMEDREVLAYLIARSLSSMLAQEEKRRWRRSQQHRPAFDCGCFDCYTSFWIRWDASPNRELIHDVIEAFEEHLAKAEGSAAAGKRAKGRRFSGKNRSFWISSGSDVAPVAVTDAVSAPEREDPPPPTALVKEEPPMEGESPPEERAVEDDEEGRGDAAAEAENDAGDARRVAAPSPGRSLVRKLVPDVMGFFASRLWAV
ncbi:uncharacterized protein LOC116256995 [Nymphaea colorata]|uniref:Uncharacterized protein n=1 Tax=Nymphaea colorata TaxID=210225 RepID=A0A5K1FB58_9MAGN|nr:uncharacterized protein LOC116256995 [Nymphaea colorata]VVW59890.1 unnamed protein product [Nymphaea colorata]